MSNTIPGPDGKPRCSWCAAAPEFFDYHDKEWGYPVADDIRLFEKVCLESFQSGLSWRTILAKRENFRSAFCHFDFNKVAKFTEADIEQLMNNSGIVRNRKKIEATINNAICAQQMLKEEGSLAAFFWQFEPDQNDLVEPQTASTSKESIELSKALKKRGWKFVGPTTAYAFMQAMGLVNDHAYGCIYREKVAQARKKFTPPSLSQ